MITGQTIVVRVKEINGSKMDGEIVLMSSTSEKYFSMNPVASRIWELVDKPCTGLEILDKLLEEYNVDRQRCLADVIEILEKLNEEELVIIN